LQTDLKQQSTLIRGFLTRLLPDQPLPALDNETIESLTEHYGLPLHLYFQAGVRSAVGRFAEVIAGEYPNAQILFAVKSNPCRGAIRTAHALGCGCDTVSEYELRAALEVGVPNDRLICNGNAKSDTYLQSAIGVEALIAADSFDEVRRISVIARANGKTARILLRLSGMALDGLTVADQSTAASWTKFGEPIARAEEFYTFAEQVGNVQPIGISAHIGTQICDPAGYERLGETLLTTAEALVTAGHRVEVIDIGGGYPLSYLSKAEWEWLTGRLRNQLSGEASRSEYVTFGGIPMGYDYLKGRPPTEKDSYRGKAYWTPYPGEKMLSHFLSFRTSDGRTTVERLRKIGAPRLLVEPGRGLFGEAGITVAKVIGTKLVEGNLMVIVDLGIVNHGTVLVSPDVYPFGVWPPREDDVPVEAFVAGRLCFTGDMISKVKISLNRKPEHGDLLFIGMTGAYSADHFASNSCGFPRPAKIALDETGNVEVWRKAERFEDVFCEL